MKTKDILVSIIGLDEPGIVAATAETLTRLGCNIEQMTQTTLRDQFTAVYLVNKPEDIENKNIRLEIQTAYDAKKFRLFRLFGETGSSMVPWSRSELAREKDAAKFPS